MGILRAAVPHLHITGGEPLMMRSDIIEIVAAARALGFRTVTE